MWDVVSNPWIIWPTAIVAAAATLSLLAFLWWTIPRHLVDRENIPAPKDRADLEDAYRKTIAQLIGGLAFVGTFGFTIYQFTVQQNQTTRQNANQQFVDAAKLLTEKDTGTQAAGLHTMGQLALNQPEYTVAVLDTINSYIKSRQTPKFDPFPPFILEQTRAAVFVLNRLTLPVGSTVDLRHAYLVHADFSSKTNAYKGANFRGATLYGTVFTKNDLTGAYFDGSHMADWEAHNMSDPNYKNVRDDYVVHFDGANLTDATFDHVWIGAANFSGSCLAGTGFWDADISRADFTTADFGGDGIFSNCKTKDKKIQTKNAKVYFTDARLIQANFCGKDASEVNFSGANLAGAIFKGANLTKTDFSKAVSLMNTDFSNADLTGTIFKNTNLSGADFSKAKNIEKAIMAEACTIKDQPAKFPEGPRYFRVCPETPRLETRRQSE